MLISTIIYKLFPKSVFVSLRKIYHIIQKKIYRPLSEKEFRKILNEDIRITKGSVVFIHSSMDSLNLKFDTLRLLEILVETVGETGTLIFPCWHFTYRAEDYLRKGEIFNVRRSPSALGMLSEMARRFPGAKRSLHPTNSIVAIGKQADYITESHHTDIYPCGERSPYFRCMLLGGLIAGIGVDAHFMSFVHCPEDVLKQKFPIKTRLNEVFDAKVINREGSMMSIKTLAAHPQTKNNDIRGFIKKCIPNSICRNFKITGNRFFVAHSKELFDKMIELSEQNKTIYTDKAVIRNSED